MNCPECDRPTPVDSDGLIVAHHADKGVVCPMSGSSAYVWSEAAVRLAVGSRSGGICEYCCAARAAEMHHRIPRSVGGRWTPANILHLCCACHKWITDSSGESLSTARRRGLYLRSTEDPMKVPLTRKTGQMTLLSDDVTPPRRSHVRAKRSLG